MNKIGVLLIGVFAGITAIVGPRLITQLATQDPTGEITLFSGDYLLLSCALAIMIGGGVMLLKWTETDVSPKDTFAAALAFPAVIAGGLNMTATVNDLEEAKSATLKLSNEILSTQGIKVESAIEFQRLSRSDVGERSNQARWHPTFIAPAYAQGQETLKGTVGGFQPGRIVQPRQYFIFLDRLETKEEATEALKKFEIVAPNAVAVQGGDRFFILESTNTRVLSDATVEALRLKSRLSAKGIQATTLGVVPTK